MHFSFKECSQQISLKGGMHVGLLTAHPHSRTEKLMSNDNMVPLDSQSLDYEVMASLMQSKNQSMALELNLRLTRKLQRSVSQIIAPPALLVALSWAVYMIKLIKEVL